MRLPGHPLNFLDLNMKKTILNLRLEIQEKDLIKSLALRAVKQVPEKVSESDAKAELASEKGLTLETASKKDRYTKMV